MWVCEQCQCDYSLTNRVILELCGHKKCRQCFLKDNEECSQCQKQIINGSQDDIKDGKAIASLVINTSLSEKDSKSNNILSEGIQTTEDAEVIDVLEFSNTVNTKKVSRKLQKYLLENDEQCSQSKKSAIVECKEEKRNNVDVSKKCVYMNNKRLRSAKENVNNSENKHLMSNASEALIVNISEAKEIIVNCKNKTQVKTDCALLLPSGKKVLETTNKTMKDIHLVKNDHCIKNNKEDSDFLEVTVTDANSTISEAKNASKKSAKLPSILAKANYINKIVDKDGACQYHCLECNRKFRSRTQKYYHLDCGRKASPNLQCNLCSQTFSNPAQIRYHMATHSDGTVKCSVCQRIFANSFVLRKHEKLHNRELIPCEHCDRKLRTKKALESHINSVHNNIKPFKCEKCGHNYGSLGSYQQHIIKHSSEQSFICEKCGVCFRSNQSLKLHLDTHSHEQSFYCDFCGKKFINSTSYRRHLRAHKTNITYSCKICDVVTFRKDNMLRHLRNFHSKANFETNVQITQVKGVNNTNVENGEELIAKENETTVEEPVILETLAANTIENLAVNQEQCEPLFKTVANSSVIKCIGNVEPVQIPQLSPEKCVHNMSETMTNVLEPEASDENENVNNGEVFKNDRLPNIELYRRILEEEESDSITEDDSFQQQQNTSSDDIYSNCDNVDNSILSENICEIPTTQHRYQSGEEVIAEILIPNTLHNETGQNWRSTNQAFKHPTMHWRKCYKYYYESEYNKNNSSS